MNKNHRLNHHRPLKVRICALLLMLTYLLAIAGIIVIAYSFIFREGDRSLLIAGLSMMGGALLSILLFWANSSMLRCVVCTNPLLLSKRCNKSPRAKTLFGRHDLRVAVASFFLGIFRCMYCGEKVTAKLFIGAPSKEKTSGPARVVSTGSTSRPKTSDRGRSNPDNF